MKLKDIPLNVDLKFDRDGNPRLDEGEKKKLGIQKNSTDTRRLWFTFSCLQCGFSWKKRIRAYRLSSCGECGSNLVKMKRLGRDRVEKSVEESKSRPIAQLTFSLASRRDELVRAYNRIPHRANLEVEQ